MLKRNHHNFYFLLIRRQNGAVLLILLAMILIAVTAVIVSQLSLNAQSINRAKNTTLALSYSKNILLGYALSQPVPGTLPCPDIDNDGDEDRNAAQACINRRGLLPYKTLGIARQVDGAGQLLWYVVDTNYVGAAATGDHNSSHTASLRIDSGSPLAFILIASNSPLPGQSPDLTLLNVTQFLEGDNADNTLDTYGSLKDETHNDVLLGMTAADFWAPIEKMVLDEVEQLVRDYAAACEVFPWAADFNDLTANSVDNNFQGGFPFGVAMPFNWGTTCSGDPIPALPAWGENWRRNLYYAMCNDATPTSPPTNCLTVMTDSPPNHTAAVILIAPGIQRTGQNRTIFTPNNFFEGNNISTDNTFDSLTPGANNNDSLRIISP